MLTVFCECPRSTMRATLWGSRTPVTLYDMPVIYHRWDCPASQKTVMKHCASCTCGETGVHA